MNFFSTTKTLGILGGGQLGKMLLYSTRKWDIKTKVLDPSESAPCRLASDIFVQGDLTDFQTVYDFGKDVDVLTIEIEKVNVKALEKLEQEGVTVYPQPQILKTIQNKCLQKKFYLDNNIPSALFEEFDSINALKEKVLKGDLSYPFVWKSAEMGYDGYGVSIIRSKKELEDLNPGHCLIEEMVNFKKELSVIVARNISGEMKCFPVVEMEFNENSNLVEYVMCPANISNDIEKRAMQIAMNTSEKFNMVGLLAVELFLTKEDEILINEVAPRPHNSGHHTIECCMTSQFDQHIRSILDLPLGETEILIPGIMVNLVGENKVEGNVIYKNINDIFDIPGVFIHIYGKKKSRLNRKMGHITIVNKDINKAIEIGKKIKKKIKVIS